MSIRKALCAAGIAASFSASAADFFFVVGQANATWRGESAAVVAPGDVRLLGWTAASRFTSSASLAGRDAEAAGPLDGVVPSFAHTWSSLSKSPAFFAVLRTPEAAVTHAGANGKAYWTDYSASVYQDAVRSFKSALQNASTSSSEGISRRYLIWIQNEADAGFRVFDQEYQSRLGELFERFGRDVSADGRPLDAVFVVSSGLMRDGTAGVVGKKGGKVGASYLGNVNAIVRAQDALAARGDVVMISRSLRSPLGACAQGVGGADCESKDLLQYYAWLYENLGAEMARNAHTYHAKGIKPLLPAQCKQSPANCSATVDVYRWVVKADAKSAKVYGTDPYEMDDASYRFIDTRFALFQDDAPGRIPVYRSTEGGRFGLSLRAPADANARPLTLGYCYAAPTGNATARLVAVEHEGLTSFVRYPADIGADMAIDPQHEKILCYVS